MYNHHLATLPGVLSSEAAGQVTSFFAKLYYIADWMKSDDMAYQDVRTQLIKGRTYRFNEHLQLQVSKVSLMHALSI